MTVQTGSNKWSTTKEGHNMETFKNHIESMEGVFRWSHTNVQNVAVVERDSFEEHDERIKVFRRCNHPDISELRTANTGGAPKSLNLAELLALAAVRSVTEHRFSPN
jgi:hypothetical protein